MVIRTPLIKWIYRTTDCGGWIMTDGSLVGLLFTHRSPFRNSLSGVREQPGYYCLPTGRRFELAVEY